MKKSGFLRRWIAMLLSVVMVFSLLLVVQTDAVTEFSTQTVDSSTMDSWKNFFDPDRITTAHAGGVWTDKSVFTTSPFQNIVVNQNNFLVALSALGSNSVVVGQTYAPTDTMFVLDVSNSMSNNALSNMVTATNNAIRTLLEGEENTNRVGVVLYGTTASVLLPLDHYTGVSVNGVENFIELSGSSIRAARTQILVGTTTPQKPDWWDEDRWGTFPPAWWPEDDQAQYETVYLKNSAGSDVTTSASTGGGTYIQGGLWKAWQEFSAASVESSATVKRTPAMVLMSDGAPTYSASDFDNVPNRSNWGTGSDSYDGDGFVTQLTSAYIKAKMAQKYGTKAYFYTLGLDVGDIAIAEAVLNPKENQTTALADLWTNYLALQNGSTLSVAMRNDNSSRNVSIDKVAEITSSNYVDRYFAATQISDLNRQFQNIVNEISLSAGYYPTHLDDNGSNYSGYITFVDELGLGMEVKTLEGIVIGDTLYTGELLARALNSGVFGTKDAPTAMGDEFVQSIKMRLGIDDTAEIWNLIDYSYNTRKSLYFDAATNQWSNYIVWYGDANGEYLGYDESLEKTAAYRNACYGMLGAADGIHQASDMMYVGVQVSTELATGDQTVTFRVPASMLPVVTYQISINGDQVTENTTASLVYKPANPIRLVYEVGVRDDISDLDMIQYAKNVNGNYYLYTNKWNVNPNLDHIENNDLTYAYYEPGADNEHYYFTDDSVIYSAEDTNSTVSSGTILNAGGTYYYRHYIFEADMSTKQVDSATGNITVSGVPDFHFEQLSETAINAAITANSSNDDGLRVVPKGTMHFAHSHDLLKDDATTTSVNENYTGTFPCVREQIVDAKVERQDNGAHHYELIYMGNNGRLQVEPTQGIVLSKKMTDNSAPADAFTFDVKLNGLSEAITVKIVYVDADGKDGIPQDKTVASSGELEVALKAGESVYIYDIPAGTGYTVTEQESDVYHQTGATGATGTVLNNAFSSIVFTNEKTVYSELNVTKAVTYLKGASNANEANKPFTVTVTLTQNGAPYAGKNVYINGSTTPTVTNDDGQITFQITDKDTVNITHIPVGVEYTVTESNLPTHYTWTNSGVTADLKGTVTAAGGNAILRNTYTPDDLVATNINFTIEKILKKADGTVIDDWGSHRFTFMVSRWDPQHQRWSPLYDEGDVLRTNNNKKSSRYIPDQTYTEAGTYYYRIEEDVGTTPGMTYDRTFHDFAVTVTDNDLNGKLEISSVTSVQNAVVTASSGVWSVSTTFTNTYEAKSTKISFTGKKTLKGGAGTNRPLKEGEFSFTLTGNGVHETVSNQADGSFAFSGLTFNEAGDYEFAIDENKTHRLGGVTYVQNPVHVTVKVTDNGAGQLVASIDGNPVTQYVASFVNTYAVQNGHLSLEGFKELNGAEGTDRPLKAGEFSFTLTDPNHDFTYISDPATGATAIGNTLTVFNGADGKIVFPTILYDAVGTHTYTITENKQADGTNGITYDKVVYTVTVEVTDNQSGLLIAKITKIEAKTGEDDAHIKHVVDFFNGYSAKPADVIIAGNKVLENVTPGIPQSNKFISLTGDNMTKFPFNFLLEAVTQGAPMPRGSADGKLTVSSGADGVIAFPAITFNAVGEYAYTVKEIIPANSVAGVLNGVTYTVQTHEITVKVTDNKAGQLEAKVFVGTTEKTLRNPMWYSLTSIKHLLWSSSSVALRFWRAGIW